MKGRKGQTPPLDDIFDRFEYSKDVLTVCVCERKRKRVRRKGRGRKRVRRSAFQNERTRAFFTDLQEGRRRNVTSQLSVSCFIAPKTLLSARQCFQRLARSLDLAGRPPSTFARESIFLAVCAVSNYNINVYALHCFFRAK